jgi:hypothetical protein
VPRRFGLGAILAFMTLLAIVFGVLRFYQASPRVYLFLGLLGGSVFLAQMFSRDSPRKWSFLAGGLWWILLVLAKDFRNGQVPALVGLPCSFLGGGIWGYVAGVVVAGVFLLGDMLERRLRGRVESESQDEPSLPPGTPVYTPQSCAPYLSEEAARMTSESSQPSRVKKLGPPTGVPVYNCIALVSPRDEQGIVHVRAANIADLKTTGTSEREALQHLVGAFKILISQCLAEGRAVPILDQPHPPEPGETERLIAVHL